MGQRMYKVLQIIQECKTKAISAKEIQRILSEEYDIVVDIKTVYSLIQRINEFFEPILHQDYIVCIHRVGYMIKDNYFEDGQLQFLLDSVVYNQDLKEEEKQALNQKLLHLSSFHQQSRLIINNTIENSKNFTLLLHLTTIIKAISDQKTIVFEYIDYDVNNNRFIEVPSHRGNRMEGKLYCVSPYHLAIRDGHYYLISYYDQRKEQLTAYRLDRMRKLHTAREKYIDVREQYNMEEEIAKALNMYMTNKMMTLQLSFDQSALREVNSRFSEYTSARKLIHERYLMTIENVPISYGLKGWIRMMGRQVIVESPIELREELMKEYEECMNNYK